MILIVHLITWHEFTALCGGTCNKVFNKVLGRSLRACCRLISLAGREFTTGSNCSGKQIYGVILKLQLSKRACLTNQKSVLSFIPVVSYGDLPLLIITVVSCHLSIGSLRSDDGDGNENVSKTILCSHSRG